MREIRSSGSVEGVVSNHDPYSDLMADWEPISHRAETVGNKALLRRRLRDGGIDRFIIFCEILAKYRQGLGFICVPANPIFEKAKSTKEQWNGTARFQPRSGARLQPKARASPGGAKDQAPRGAIEQGRICPASTCGRTRHRPNPTRAPPDGSGRFHLQMPLFHGTLELPYQRS